MMVDFKSKFNYSYATMQDNTLMRLKQLLAPEQNQSLRLVDPKDFLFLDKILKTNFYF